MGFTMKDMVSMKGVLIKGRVLALRGIAHWMFFG